MNLRAMRVRTLSLLALSCALVGASGAHAQSNEVLREEQVTTGALIEMLTPMKMRGIKTRGVVVQPSERPQASLLITFETNSTVLTASARRSLDAVGTALKSNELLEYNFNIEGHADPRGNPESNLRLSEGRAAAVRQYLVDAHRISPTRLSTIGKGDREPLNRVNIAAPENRRVTIVNLSN